MKGKKSTKRALLMSVLSIIVCMALLIGSTFAWFSASATNSGNKIEAGTLNISLWQKQADGTYADISANAAPVFNYDKWEPGYTAVQELQLRTSGTLALRYQVSIGGLETLDPATTKNIENVLDITINGIKIGTLANFAKASSVLLSGTLIPQEAKTSADLKIEIHMQETAGNEYQGGVLPRFDIKIEAAQYTYEVDGYGSDQYDTMATPQFGFSKTVNHVEGTDTKVIEEEGFAVTVPAAAATDYITAVVKTDSVTQTTALTTVALTISVKNSADVDVPADIEYYVGTGLIDVKVQHNGVEMAASEYSYNSTTGIVTIHCTSYSPFSVTYMTAEQYAAKYWSKNVDTSWYNSSATEFIIMNAKQLAGVAQLVNAGTSFSGKTLKVGADIDLAGKEWTPIGLSESKSFKGTFLSLPGSVFTISNITVNNNSYNGLFGYIYNATIQDINVNNATISYEYSKGVAGGALFGYALASTITNCDVTGTVKIESTVGNGGQCANGGLIGQADAQVDDYNTRRTVISECHVTAEVTINNIGDGSTMSLNGGFVGASDSTTISNCSTAKTTINSGYRSRNGGFVGYNNSGSIIDGNCSSSNVTITNFVVNNSKAVDSSLPANGGFAGMNPGTINGPCSATNISITGGNQSYNGGFIGRNNYTYKSGTLSGVCTATTGTISGGTGATNGVFFGSSSTLPAGCSATGINVVS